jgi:hypothetical protein
MTIRSSYRVNPDLKHFTNRIGTVVYRMGLFNKQKILKYFIENLLRIKFCRYATNWNGHIETPSSDLTYCAGKLKTQKV